MYVKTLTKNKVQNRSVSLIFMFYHVASAHFNAYPLKHSVESNLILLASTSQKPAFSKISQVPFYSHDHLTKKSRQSFHFLSDPYSSSGF
jgi:hypothetical protein